VRRFWNALRAGVCGNRTSTVVLIEDYGWHRVGVSCFSGGRDRPTVSLDLTDPQDSTKQASAVDSKGSPITMPHPAAS